MAVLTSAHVSVLCGCCVSPVCCTVSSSVTTCTLAASLITRQYSVFDFRQSRAADKTHLQSAEVSSFRVLPATLTPPTSGLLIQDVTCWD